jgi:cytochrome c oxidase subunit II
MKKYVLPLFVIAVMLFSFHAFSMGGNPPAEPKIVPITSDNIQEIRMTAKQFEFVPSVIQVKQGIPVRLLIVSQDVTHSFVLDAFKVNESVESGKVTVVDFTPDKTGTFEFHCGVYCGLGHMGMNGKLIVN